MKHLLVIVSFAWALSSCTHQQVVISQDKALTNDAVSTAIVHDSIDKYGYSGCVKPFHNELIISFEKAVDSAWDILVANDKKRKSKTIYSKGKFKEALIADNFAVDSSDKWGTATKRGFNERWRAEWLKDSNYVQLIVTRWYQGYTYQFMIGGNKFDK